MRKKRDELLALLSICLIIVSIAVTSVVIKIVGDDEESVDESVIETESVIESTSTIIEEPETIMETEVTTMSEIEEKMSLEEETTKRNYNDLIIGTRISYDYVNVRSAPNTDASVYKTVDPKTEIHITDERSDGWTEICMDDEIFYIKSDYIGKEDGYENYLVEQEKKKDHTPYSSYLVNNYGFDYDKQKYLWKKCCQIYSDLDDQQKLYAFVLGLMQRESAIGTYHNKSHWNSNGTRDLGIMQVNSSNWGKLKKAGIISSYDPYNLTCDELQYNDYIGMDAGFYMLTPLIVKYGVSEDAYYAYNTGKSHGGSNENSRIVWKYYKEWYDRLW